MPIKCIQPRLAVVGRIKIGGLGEARAKRSGEGTYQPPVKHDFFTITRMDRGNDGNFIRDESIHSSLGEKPTEIPVTLLYNDLDLNWRTELALYDGKSCACRGDGERAVDLKTGEEKVCPCPQLEARRCKPHGNLQVLMADAQICGGVWQFSTTSWNSIINLESSLRLLLHVSKGKIAGVPLFMRVYKKTTTTPDGKPTTIPVVGLFFRGNPVTLLEQAVQREKQLLQAGIQVELLEHQVREEMRRRPAPMPIDDDLAGEFHPEEDEPEDAETITDALKASEAAMLQPSGPAAPATPAPIAPPVTPAAVEPPPPVKATTNPAAPITSQPTETPQTPGPEIIPESPPAPNVASIPEEIAALRSKHKIMQGDFIKLVKQTTGKIVLDPTKWAPEHLVAVRDAMVAKWGAAA